MPRLSRCSAKRLLNQAVNGPHELLALCPQGQRANATVTCAYEATPPSSATNASMSPLFTSPSAFMSAYFTHALGILAAVRRWIGYGQHERVNIPVVQRPCRS